MLLVSTDVRRPAAILQLERLGEQLEIGFSPACRTSPPVDIARRAVETRAAVCTMC